MKVQDLCSKFGFLVHQMMTEKELFAPLIIFMKYLTVDDEEEVVATRLGAFGSTDKKEN